MNIKPIRCDADLDAAFMRLEDIFQAAPGTQEADERDVLVTLIEVYENEHYPIAHPDPIEAIRFAMEQRGLMQKDLIPLIGRSSRVSEVLNGHRNLTLSMIVNLHEVLRIPYESLLSAVEKKAAAKRKSVSAAATQATPRNLKHSTHTAAPSAVCA